MAEYKESQLWKLIREGFKSPGTQLTRIENIASSGVPDVIMTHSGVTRFIELKVAEREHFLFFRPAQIVWSLENIKAGGSPKCIFYYNNRIGVVDMSVVINNSEFDGKYRKFNILDNMENIGFYAKPYQYGIIIKEVLNESI